MLLIKSFLIGVLELIGVLFICAYLNEGDKVRECFSCLKMMMQAPTHVVSFSQYFSLNVHYLNDSISIKTAAIKHNF